MEASMSSLGLAALTLARKDPKSVSASPRLTFRLLSSVGNFSTSLDLVRGRFVVVSSLLWFVQMLPHTMSPVDMKLKVRTRVGVERRVDKLRLPPLMYYYELKVQSRILQAS